MPHAAYMATACALNGRLYVMGGFDSNRLQVLEMTEENGLAWTVKAEMPATRRFAASFVHEGKIWVIGGFVADQLSTSVATYDPDADTWATGPPLPLRQRDGCATTYAIDGRVYLCTAVESRVFRFEGAAWSEIPGAGNATTFGACSGAVLLG